MIEIDGSSGGGQMLRNSLALSAVTGEAFRMENVRSRRPNPGLKRQHLKAVKAAARMAEAEVEGAEEGSKRLEFRPSGLRSDGFTVNIGTAGSVTLLLDTLLPVITQFPEPFRVTVKGGTDVKWSPTVAYLREVKLPLLSRFGMDASLELGKTGFYPRGGGEVELETRAFSMEPVELRARGELQRFEIFSKASRELEERSVADRQADEAARMLKNSRVSTELEKNVEYVETDSPGSSLTLKAVYENSVAGFDSLGERGKRSEEVSREVVQAFKRFHSGNAAVDEHMADQLVVFLAVVGGEVSIPRLTDHVQTSVEVVKKFDRDVSIEENGGNYVLRR